MERALRCFGIILVLGLLKLADTPAPAPPPFIAAPVSPINRSLDEIRRASASWERRPGPDRQVVDLVCLVPDLPTFLEAIATWDEAHDFPILIDDVELTFKFLRAFRPARIVRSPRPVAALPADQGWDRAVAAVGRAWASEDGPQSEARAGGHAVPGRLGPTPPGVVLSSPES